MNKRLVASIKKSSRSIFNMLPMICGIILLIGLLNTLIPNTLYKTIFSKNTLLDSFIGSAIGSVLAGNPITSYILGGEFLKNGINIIAVTSFIVAWVTVGIIQLPAEASTLGRRFALTRNALSFVFSIIVAFVTVFVMGLI